MPTRVVDITLTTETAVVPEQTVNTPVAIGTAASSPPGANFGEANMYSSADEVANDYGQDTDVHTASEALEAMAVQSWYVIVLEETETTETLGPDSTTSNAPILGDPTPTAASGSLSFTTDSPPDVSTEDTDSVLNTDTGEFDTSLTDDDLTYTYVDWSVLDTALEGEAVDIVHRADMRMMREHIGTLDELTAWADNHTAAMVAAHMNGNNAATEQEAIQTAHDIGTYVESGSLLTFAHKSSADVAAYVAGQCANEEAHFDPFYDGDGYPFETDFYRRSNVGSPDEEGTFEGGLSGQGTGPTNVIIEKADTKVLSNSLTTAGPTSDYQYWDIRRTEDYAQRTVENALAELRLEQDQIPFTREGRALISDAIRGAFSGDVGGVDDPFSSLSVTVPDVESLSDTDRTERRWSGITIDATLSGNVHEFTLEMNVSV